MLTGLLILLPYTPPARESTSHSNLGSHTAIINQENGPQTCPQVNWMEAALQMRFPSPGF